MVYVIGFLRSFVDIFRSQHSQPLHFDYSTPSFDGSVAFSDDSVLPSFDFANNEGIVVWFDYVLVEEEDLHDIEGEASYDIVPHRSFESWSMLE